MIARSLSSYFAKVYEYTCKLFKFKAFYCHRYSIFTFTCTLKRLFTLVNKANISLSLPIYVDAFLFMLYCFELWVVLYEIEN